ncbi:hypothetical protein [Mesorhizobium sp. L-8-3]|uniref:hypothetical protein n=1 Tax=Mesorhizobium sp. L-8-3 TaxID=2744522 RepID=UPI00192936E5|nr:hypothetical protein [Mesorhizobium sp. L-8-3]BCH26114.1 hypothetical protein MesoLjLb_58990 [Mesorhizobium sp. L-8-3]
MWRALGIAIALEASAAIAQPNDGPKLDDTGTYAGNYLCAPLASGGVRWDETAKEWRGAAFKVPSDGQFVFEIKVLDKRKEWKAFGFAMVGTTYFANVRPLEGNAVACWGEREGYQPADLVGYNHILMSPDGEFRCRTYGGLNYYDLNLTTRRYQQTYHAGFIDGEDAGGNTPSLEVGKCTRMD